VNVPFALVDAFTRQPFSGNTAGVVFDADDLSGEQMQQIARELGQTETCFVSGAQTRDADLSLRWFTPKVEVDLCGHATVGTFVALAAEGRIPWVGDGAEIRCMTRCGIIPVWLVRSGDSSPTVTLSVGTPALEAASDEPAAVARAIGLEASAIDQALPQMRERAGARLIVPIARLSDLLDFEPDGARTIAFGEPRGYRRFTLVCRETEDPARFAHLRHFAPANGIPEDPVTGTAHAVAAVYFDRLGMLPAGERVALSGEQGHAVGRRGVVAVEVLRADGRIRDVRIGGSGVIVASGTIATP
jgi:PhzF family phenazine biosynthesis protein